ncbi:hypothetical protein, partial [Micromonospora sp. KC606]|uniref:hypothetical protein n=1 Tax=Micromonospora sp. KC606 TaxID=2530379 RepID=UPI001A9E8816
MTTSEPERVASRRTLLRRAAVTGGAAVAATAATGLAAAPASASAGDPLLIGQSNTGGATTITSAAPDGAATLALRNATGATLQLTDGNSFDPGAPSGAISVNATGLGVRSGNGGQRAFSTANATMLVPV